MVTATEIDTELMSIIIKEETGINDDAFQEAWVLVLEAQTTDAEQIRQIARQCRRKYANEKFAERFKISLDQPAFKEGDKTDSDIPKLSDFISAPTITTTEEATYRSGHARRRLSTWARLDEETAQKLQERFPNVPYWRGIRALLGLPPIIDRVPFQKWEDDIIRQYYPDQGSVLVKKELHDRGAVTRTYRSIRVRASQLGIRRSSRKQFVANPNWLRQKDVERILGCSVKGIINKGYLKQIRLETLDLKAKPRFNLVYIDKADLFKFMRRYPVCYDHSKVSLGYRRYISSNGHLVAVAELAKELGYTRQGLMSYIVSNNIGCVIGWHRTYYVDAQRVREAIIEATEFADIRHSISNSRHFKLVKIENRSGCLTHIIKRGEHIGIETPSWDKNITFDLWNIIPACKGEGASNWNPRMNRPQFVDDRIPTCKVCLGVFKKWQKEELKKRVRDAQSVNSVDRQ
jgi:hypothetical protein